MWPQSRLYAPLWPLSIMFSGPSPSGRASGSFACIMVTSNPVGDMLIRIKNGYLARKSEVLVPWSKMKEATANILVKKGYLDGLEIETDGHKKELVLKLKYEHKKSVLTDVKVISRPGLRIYVKKNELPKILGGLGTAIISTPVGLLTDKEARSQGLGGEVVCEIW